jgi:hypothetical protein
MTGTKTTSLKDSTVAQISAAVFYQSNVMAKMISDKDVQRKFTKVIFQQIEKDFGLYIDSQARSKPKQLHHVYEWKKIGTPTARLFDLKLIDEYGFSSCGKFKLNLEDTDVSRIKALKTKRKLEVLTKAVEYVAKKRSYISYRKYYFCL